MKQSALIMGAGVAIAVGVAVAWGRDPATGAEETPRTLAERLKAPNLSEAKAREYRGLHNVVAFHEGLLSGSVPEGEAGFQTLAAMGIKTIISVDGAEPDVPNAKALGLRYIHLPIGYNGFDEQRKVELVRATRDAMLAGPVYIHCHHGKHRSAAAAATIAASLGWATPDAMVGRMRVAGTAPAYEKLYECASGAKPLRSELIDAVAANFPEISKPTSFVKAMIEVDAAFDHLRVIEQAGWTTPKDHPDLVPVAEAGLIADHMRTLADGRRARDEPPGFAEGLRKDASLAQKLEDMLGGPNKDAKKLSEQFRAMGASCRDCHVKFRD